jgi:hypothetical protein
MVYKILITFTIRFNKNIKNLDLEIEGIMNKLLLNNKDTNPESEYIYYNLYKLGIYLYRNSGDRGFSGLC